jgi:AcrR family transcriptional regulator
MAHTPSTTKGRHTRARLLSAARSVFGRDGYVGTTMSAVASEADMSLGGLYRYFRDKEDLFAALIADTHAELFEASGNTTHDLATNPYETLLEANEGYLAHYYQNRDIMRTLVEAASVEERFREYWWQMRNRHIERFTRALKVKCGLEEVDGLAVRDLAEAAACMVEQSAYVWYAQDKLRKAAIPVAQAARIVTRIWYNTFFSNTKPPAPVLDAVGQVSNRGT